MPECFSVLADEIEGRIDPFYYKPSFIESKHLLEKGKYNLKLVSDFSELVVDGIHKTPEYSREGLKFIQVNNISEGQINFSKNIKFVDKSWEKEVLARYFPKKGDVLITKDGTIGIAAVVPKIKEKFSIFVSVACIRPNQKLIMPKYLEIILSSSIVKDQISRSTRGAALVHLLLEDIRKLKIPLPPLKIQNKIVQLMDKAYSSKKSKEVEAKKLIDSSSDYVLNELGIELPKIENKIIYVINSYKVKENRIDPYYYQPKFEEIEEIMKKGEYNLKNIGDLNLLNNQEKINNYVSINYVDLSSINKELGIINKRKSLNIKEVPSRARQKIEKGDLLISSLIGSLKSIAIFDGSFDNAICSTGFYVIKESNEYNNRYLWALFRNPIMQMILQREGSGAIMSAINRKSLVSIKIPLPPLSVQNKIAKKVKQRMQKAGQLQEKAKEVLEKAKLEVEKIILG